MSTLTDCATLAAVKDVVVLVAHGTVEDLDQMEAFLLEIRRGRPAPSPLIAEMRHRYEQVGGSPLLRETRAQADALALALGKETRVAMRLSAPRLLDVVEDLGPSDRVTLLPVAPYSVAIYESAARKSLEQHPSPPEFLCVQPWGVSETLVAAHVDLITETLTARAQGKTHVILSAHSLPRVVIERGDPYAEQFEAAARKIGERLGVAYSVAYQSQGADDGNWLGPDLSTVVRELGQTDVETLAVAPIGFLTEHVETLFDLDVETRAEVTRLGKNFVRVPALGTHPGLIRSMMEAVSATRH